ncbi:MAG: hypothetical protein JW757_02085 [Anaerolineales bacterium]|nr:hypothetical protein [Anaerolineales bacterium]
MKQITLLVLALSLVGIMAFGIVSDASAEEISPMNPGNGRGNGRNGGGTGTGIPMEMNVNLDGALDEFMSQYIADGLGISVETLKAREEAGETLTEIGLSLGFDAQAVFDLHVETRIAALNQAVVDGLITAEQAEWMISRLDNSQSGFNAGTCTGDCDQTVQKYTKKRMTGNRYSNNQP